MTNNSEDRTIAFQDPTTVLEGDPVGGGGAAAGVPRARLICLDTSQIEGPLPGDGVIRLLAGSEQIVGRGDTCTFTIPSRKLSRQHVRLFPGVGVWGVEDMNSTNGIQVNRTKVKTAWLNDGDEVRFGPIPFRFEIERTEGAVGAPRVAAAPEEGSEDRTMMVGSLGASRAVIEAAQRREEPPPPPTPKAVAAQAAAPKKGGGARIIVAILLAVLVVAGLAVAAVLYFPTFQADQDVAAIVSREQPVVQRVIVRGRDSESRSEADIRSDLDLLGPVVDDLNRALRSYPNRPELANLYARARMLVFERGFGKLFSSNQTEEAGRMVADLKDQIQRIEAGLPKELAEKDKADLLAVRDIADLAGILVTYREFTRRYDTVGAPGNEPTVEMLDRVERRKADLDKYSRTLHRILVDYRLFNATLKEFEARDLSLIGRWRQIVRSPQ